MDYKALIAQNVRIEGISEDEILSLVQLTQDTKLGDFCLPCFRLSKALKKSPQSIAEDLQKAFPKLEQFEKVEAVSGYLNFKISRTPMIKKVLTDCLDKGDDFLPFKANGKTICIDYSSINIAKQMHIGHLLTTVIGGSLYKIYKYLGYNVVGINHLGDYGTQFGKLITAYKMWDGEKVLKEEGLDGLVRLYVRINAEAEKDESLNDTARAWFKKIEDGDVEANQIFTHFKSITMQEVENVYSRLGVEFDSYNGESFYNDKIAPTVALIQEKGILKDSNGAKVVDLEPYNMPPCLILRSDGASLYATRDIAAAIYRKNTYNFDKCLYVVAYQQNLHFAQFFKVLELMDYDFAKDCVHVSYGMVSLEGGGSLSTRKGNLVLLKDVLQAAVDKASDVISQKNPNLENKEQTAEQVGVGAVIFGALCNSKIKDIVFSLDKALSFEGETAPYLQYTHARCCSILEKASEDKSSDTNIDYSDLNDDESYEVIRLLERFDETVMQAATRYEPSIISKYLIDLAQSFNRFYINNKVLGNYARLALTTSVKNTLKNGLALLLIQAPNKM